VDATACKGFTSEETPCRSASCTDGKATLAATCNGRGACPTPIVDDCSPYACNGTACGTSCASDADCDAMFTCNHASSTCVSRDAASCDGQHTLIAPNGASVDCAPYACLGAVCRTTCVSVLDCVYPSECSSDHECSAVRSDTQTPNGSSDGCACGVVAKSSGDGRRAPLVSLALAAALAARRRRRGSTRR
jgi:hypothetical protein